MRLLLATSVLLSMATLVPFSLLAQDPVKQKQAEYDSAYDAHEAAETAANNARDKATKIETELKALKKQKQEASEIVDGKNKTDRLKEEIRQIEEKLKDIDKAKDKKIFRINNPGAKVPMTPGEQAVTTEALGGHSVPVVPASIRQSFEEHKKKLQEKLKRLKKELKDAESDASKPRDQATVDAAQKKLQTIDDKIKALEEKLAAAKADLAIKVAEEKAARAKRDAARTARNEARDAAKREQDLEDAKKKLKEAQKNYRQAVTAFGTARDKLNSNSGLASLFSTIFEILDLLVKMIDEVTDVNADPLGALEKATKALERIDKILNDPKSVSQRVKNELLIPARNAVREALNRLRTAYENVDKAEKAIKEAKAGKKTSQRTGKRKNELASNSGTRFTTHKSVHAYQILERASMNASVADVQNTLELVSGQISVESDSMVRMELVDVQNIGQELLVAVDRASDFFDAVQTVNQNFIGSDSDNYRSMVESAVASLSPGNATSQLSPDDQANIYRVAFENFGPQIVAGLASNPESGARVLKGNAGSTEGSSTLSVTLTLSPSDSGTDSNQGSEVQVAIVDERGEFEINIPQGQDPQRIMIGGRQNTSRILHIDDFGAGNSEDSTSRPELHETLQQTRTQRFEVVLNELLFSSWMDSTESDSQPWVTWSTDTVQKIFPTNGPGPAMPSDEFMEGEWELATTGIGAGGNSHVNLTEIVVTETVLRNASSEDSESTIIPQRIVVTTNNDTEFQELQTELVNVVRDTMRSTIDTVDNIRLETTDIFVTGSQSSDSTGQQHTVVDVQITDGQGNRLVVDPVALQVAVQTNPQLAGKVATALPRDATSRDVNDAFFRSRNSWGNDYADQWALHRVGFGPELADSSDPWFVLESNSTPIIVAVIGSGVDWTHPELFGQIWVNPDEVPGNGIDDDRNGYVDDLMGWNYRDNNKDVMDYGGHDTHVAGVIAARTNNGAGIASVNPNARIMPLKVANFLGHADAISIARAIVYAVDNGARVINISYVGEQPSMIEQKAIDYARLHDVTVVVASGNKGIDAGSIGLAGATNVITVAASDTEDKRARFSNWGQPIDVIAPGMDVLSLRAKGSDFLLYTGDQANYEAGVGITGKHRDLYRASGTSFSAPFVAGVASLMISQDSGVTTQQIKNKLTMTARDIDTPGWDQNSGNGIVNGPDALAADPDHFLVARITRVAPARQDNNVVVNVHGHATGSELSGRWLQIALGESPDKDAWKTISHSDQPVENGLLGSIPSSSFDRQGTWSVRILVQDQRETVRQSRATLNLN